MILHSSPIKESIIQKEEASFRSPKKQGKLDEINIKKNENSKLFEKAQNSVKNYTKINLEKS